MHSSKEMMAEMENLRAEKVSLEESSKLAGKKFEDELAELKAQIGTLQSQVYSSQKLFLMMQLVGGGKPPNPF